MMVSGDPQAVALLNRLDWQLGEAGRREHSFSWLRDAASGDWLTVDAYYPSNRVVVIASDDPDRLEHCELLVPANGLYLLTIEAPDLASAGPDDGLLGRLRDRLSEQGWVPRPAASADREEGPPSPSRRAALDGPRETWAARQTPTRVGTGDPATGVVLVLIMVAELILGGGVVGLGAGDYVLGFGLLLDACARALGAIAASRDRDPAAAWSSVLLGSLTLWSPNAGSGDAAALAQVTAILAGCAVVSGLLLAAL